MLIFSTPGVLFITNLSHKGKRSAKKFTSPYFRRMDEALRRRSPDLWAYGQWTLLHDNVRPHTALSVSRFLSKHNVTLLPHPPYSPDLSLYNFFFCFHDWKKAIRTATWKYRGYSSCCDDGAHRHSERDIHQLFSRLAETVSNVYWLRRGTTSKGTGIFSCDVEFCIFYRLSLRTLRTKGVVCVSGSQSAATHLSSGVDTRDKPSWECQNVRDVKWKMCQWNSRKIKIVTPAV